MKRFAAHYIYFAPLGFLKRSVVELSDEGSVLRIFPLTDEIESVEWRPGIILLLTSEEAEQLDKNKGVSLANLLTLLPKKGDAPKSSLDVYKDNPEGFFIPSERGVDNSDAPFYPYLLFPFDFTCMQPVAETRHRRLP